MSHDNSSPAHGIQSERRFTPLVTNLMLFSTSRLCVFCPAICRAVMAVLLSAATLSPSDAADLYVSPKGNDSWSGRRVQPNTRHTDGPFATIGRAKDEVRNLRSAGKLPHRAFSVEIEAGRYELTAPIVLTREDSGEANAPITYVAAKGAEVRVIGGRVLSGFGPVTNPAILQRLAPEARSHVLQADLKSQGITDIPGIKTSTAWGESQVGMELFFKDRPMTIARWPNTGFVKILKVPNTDAVDIRGTKGDKSGKFTYDGDRPAQRDWAGESEIWLHGYWFWDWADQRQRVQAIDIDKHQITLAPPLHSYGYRPGQWYYAFNILSELDEPGEYYVDREAGILYFWPPAPPASGEAVVSMLPTLLTMKDTSYVTWSGITFEAMRSTAITVEGGKEVAIRGCTIRNGGSWAVRISGATNSGVAGCDIYQMGEGGISLSGGDRNTLTPGNLYADNNQIHHYSRWNPVYKPAVSLDGVGNRVTHNVIHDAPHMAIGFGGNDHLVEYNEIYNVCYESNDAGAMYAGRNWTMRGTIIRYNYLHDISGYENKGCVGVYLDDQFSGTLIYGNLFRKVTRAAMIGGGRDCTIENNIFVDCVPSIHVDARGLGWAADGLAGLRASLAAMPYETAPWSSRYPKLATILAENPMAPRGNLIARNICVGGRWGDFEERARPMVTFQDNLLDSDPHFVDPTHGDFRLKPDSPALKLGFKGLPLEKIGLYKSDDRPHIASHAASLNLF